MIAAAQTQTTKARCKRCGGEMRRGVALEQTLRPGRPDFDDDDKDSRGITLVSGRGRLVACMKCVSCGWSVV